MIVRNDCITFKVMGKDINLYSEEMEYGRSTVADMNDYFYYLGNEPPNVATAIFAWQQVNGRDLTGEEFRKALIDNHIISDNTSI